MSVHACRILGYLRTKDIGRAVRSTKILLDQLLRLRDVRFEELQWIEGYQHVGDAIKLVAKPFIMGIRFLSRKRFSCSMAFFATKLDKFLQWLTLRSLKEEERKVVEITKSYHLQGHGTIGGGWEDLINGGDLYSTHSAGAGGVPGTPGVNPNLPFVSNQRVAFEAEQEEMETLASDSEEEAGADGGLIVNPGGMRAMYLGGKRKKEKRKKMRRARREREMELFPRHSLEGQVRRSLDRMGGPLERFSSTPAVSFGHGPQGRASAGGAGGGSGSNVV